MNQDAAVLRVVTARHCEADQGYFVVPADLVELTWVTAPEGMDSHAFTELMKRNTAGVRLPDGLICRGLRIHRRADIDKAFADRPKDPDPIHLGWEGFYAAYPDAKGLLTVSLPGYSADGGTALVAISASSGLRSGAGGILVLKKIGGDWKVVDRHTTVVAEQGSRQAPNFALQPTPTRAA